MESELGNREQVMALLDYLRQPSADILLAAIDSRIAALLRRLASSPLEGVQKIQGEIKGLEFLRNLRDVLSNELSSGMVSEE